MSSLAAALVSWEEFVNLPDPEPEEGKRYELHDGEVVLVPPARPVHLALQARILDLLWPLREDGLTVHQEYPYKPALNYQFWVADVAVYPKAIVDEMGIWKDYQTYAPPLVIEVLSPSNHEAKVSQQRIVSMSSGTSEFWAVDAEARTVHVTTVSGSRTYGSGEAIPLAVAPGRSVAVDAIFAGIGQG
jgi:Uma2 family endonuclease